MIVLSPFSAEEWQKLSCVVYKERNIFLLEFISSRGLSFNTLVSMGKKKRSSSGTSQAKNKNEQLVRQEVIKEVKPPDSFNFQEPATWTNWIKRYKIFHSAVGLSAVDEEQKINMLLYCMGQEADEVLSSLGITEKKRTSFDLIVTVFEEHFMTKKNIFYHRTLFLERNQRPGEKIESFIKDISKLSENCAWLCKGCKSKAFENEMILLKLITGINDKTLSKSLQIQETTTLTDVVQRLKQSETSNSDKNLVIDDHSDDFGWVTAERINRRILGAQQAEVQAKKCKSNDLHHQPDDYASRFCPKFVFQEEKGSMRCSFSSGVETGDEYPMDEPPDQIFFHSTGEWEEVTCVRSKNAKIMNKLKASASFTHGGGQSSKGRLMKCGCISEYCSHVGTNCLKENKNIDFPELPKPPREFTFPPKKKTAQTSKYKDDTKGRPDTFHYYDSSDDYNSDDEYGFLDYLREFHPKDYLAYTSNKTCSPTKTIASKVEENPKPLENYHFSVSGHQSRRALKNMCKQKTKAFTY